MVSANHVSYQNTLSSGLRVVLVHRMTIKPWLREKYYQMSCTCKWLCIECRVEQLYCIAAKFGIENTTDEGFVNLVYNLDNKSIPL